ncbi:MAG TPA: arabinofuranosidase catalytic domain-containing protein [Trebonia sp.]|nr:arabinofuranosidase catalytic domain-containing protein [Trebonia sp.]
MRAHRPARMAVAAGVGVALCAFAIVGAPARPALAAGSDQVKPGSDLTVSVPLGAVPASFASHVASTTFPSFLGLPTGTSTSLASMMTASYNQDRGAGSGAAPPPVVSDSGTLSVSTVTQTVTVTMPAADVPGSNAPGGPRGPQAAFLSSFLGTLVKYAGLTLCLFNIGRLQRLAPITAPPTVSGGQALVCGTFADIWSNITTSALSDLWSGSPPTGKDVEKIVTTVLTNVALGLVGAKYLVPLLEKYVVSFGAIMANLAVYAITGARDWLPPGPGDVSATATPAQTASDYVESISKQATPGAMNSVFAANGFPTMKAEGRVMDTALGTPSYQCMDAYQADGLPIYNDPVDINVCNATTDQDWILWSSNELTNGGLCLDITNASWSRRAKLQLYGCSGQWYQNWKQEKTFFSSKPYVQNNPGGSGYCIDDTNEDTTPGTQLQDEACTFSTAQQWQLPQYLAASTPTGPTATGYGAAGSGLPGECMDAYGSSNGASPGQVVAINGCNGSLSQDWTAWSDGTVTAWGLCLDTGGGTSAAGTPLADLETCSGAASQVWAQQPDGALRNTASGMCLDDPASSTTSGTRLQLDACDGGASQAWRLPGASTLPSPLPPLPPNASACDIYASGGTPCEAAYSMDRALYVGYNGPLYEVTRASDGTARDIGLLSAGGDVNAAEQDSFCGGTTCTVTKIYDQSPNGNTLTIEGGGQADPHPDTGADATALPIKIGGHGNEAWGLDIEPGNGYRDDAPKGIATGSQPEGMYMVASGTHVNSGCCFDFGNAEVNNDDNGAGHMDSVNVSTTCWYGASQCNGSGPWVEADLENGLYTGGGPNPGYRGNGSNFVTAMLKNNGTSDFELESGDSMSGGLTTGYHGPLPPPPPGTTSQTYTPMSKEGAVLLGTGGDNSNTDYGSFFEGVMTRGDPSDATDAAVQANIVAAGYSGTTSPAASAAASPAGQAVVHAAGATGPAASGYSSVFTVDSANGHLQESYLPFMDDSWRTQDLSSTAPMMPGTPPVMPGTKPVALVHCGYTSVYTVDAASGDLQETYLPAIGKAWATQDLSAQGPRTPPTDVTPTAVEHAAGVAGASAACGDTSVFTRDRDGDLQETYLLSAGFPGDPWATQDLSAQYQHTPAIQPGTSPVALVHCGYTSVYTVNASNRLLQETYLPAFGDSWNTQTLPAPPAVSTPTAVMHSAGAAGGTPDCGYTSVFTVDDVTRHLQETYLPNTGFPGDPWITQDLTSQTHGPAVAPGTQPEALVHLGYTSLYTVAEGSQHLQETFLPAIGDFWRTQDLTANPNYAAPLTDQSPIVLLHPDASGNLDWTSVFTIDEFTGDLMETYLPNTGFPGDPWVTQDLSASYQTPAVAVQQSSQATWSLAHDGYASIYSVDRTGDLQESYLAAMGGAWTSQDLSLPAMAGTPAVAPFTAPVALYHQGYTSVFTVDASNGDLQETFLEVLGGPWHTHDLSSSAMADTPTVAPHSQPTTVFHDGYTSVYTIDASNGDLQETYLAALGGPWVTQDLSSMAGTPPAEPGTSPVAISHDGYTSVYTVDEGGHLWETYLPVLGGPWHSQDLSANDGTPTVAPATSPTVVYHDGLTSVYTVDFNPGRPGGDLQETWLPAIGDSWVTQDLTAKYNLPPATPGDDPAALYHTGFTSVYFPDGRNGDLDEAYLPAIGDAWGWNDMTYNYHTPPTGTIPSPLVHYAFNGALTWTSVFTGDAGSFDLQETYLPDVGDSWTTQNLTQKYPVIPPW